MKKVTLNQKMNFKMPISNAKQGVDRNITIEVSLACPEQLMHGHIKYGRKEYDIIWNIGCNHRLDIVGHIFNEEQVNSFETTLKPLFFVMWDKYRAMLNDDLEIKTKNNVISLRREVI